jgi:hypothetical protein
MNKFSLKKDPETFPIKAYKGLNKKLLSAIFILFSFLANNAFAGDFSANGNMFTITLNASESVSVVSQGSSYTFTLNSGSWTGSANGASAAGSILTINSTGLSLYTTFNIEDAGAGVTVNFVNSGVNLYSDNINVLLDAGATAVNFTGTSSFSGSNAISITTDGRILFNIGASLSTIDGDLNLSANMQATPSAFNASGVEVSNSATAQVTGSGQLTIKARGGTSATTATHGIFLNNGGRLIGGTSGLTTIEGYAAAEIGVSSNYGVYLLLAPGMISSNGANVSVTGKGGSGSNFSDNYGVYVRNAIITAGSNGSVSVTGYGGNTTSISNYGVVVTGTGSGLITSNGGNVIVDGTGGGATGNTITTATLQTGVYLSGTGVIKSEGNGSTTVVGRGGNNSTGSSGANAYGVHLFGSSVSISSNNGPVSVTGTGGNNNGNGAVNHGIYLQGGGSITAGGNSPITVSGTGGRSSAGSNYGVYLVGASSLYSNITSNGGNITVTATGGGAATSGSNYGVYVSDLGRIIAGGNNGSSVSITGTGGNATGSNNHGVMMDGTALISSGGGGATITGIESNSLGLNLVNGNIDLFSKGGNINLTGNSMHINAGISVSASNAINLLQNTNGTGFNLGSFNNPLGGPVGLSNTELLKLTGGVINIGNIHSGMMTISAAMTPNVNSDLNLLTAPTAGLSPSITVGTDITMANGKILTLPSKLNISLNGPTLNTNYSQLTVDGSLDLNGITLSVSGIRTPVSGDVFTIVSATAVTGIFNGLPDGSTVILNGKTLVVNYSPTTVTLTFASTLPVSFSSLSGNIVGSGIKLDWKVAEETGISHYEVERSITGNNFKSIHSAIPATGASAYNWLDQNPYNSTSYYRIKAVEISGEFKYSSIIKIAAKNAAGSILVTPNQVSGNMIYLQFNNSIAGNYSVNLFNMKGQLITTKNLMINMSNSKFSVSMPTGLATGIYYLRITLPDGTHNTQEISILN